jgi:heme oxygenase
MSVRAALRSATNAIHQRMHGLEPFAAIADGTLSVEHYPRLLQSLLLFHSTIGAAADRHGLSHLSCAAARTELLRSDLRHLGGGMRPSLITWLPGSALETLGALYVAEGSMMGGPVIGRQLDYLFGDSLDARQFFLGAHDGWAGWRALITDLENQCATPAALDQAVRGALSAFTLFEQCVMGGLADDGMPCSAASIARTFERQRHASA